MHMHRLYYTVTSFSDLDLVSVSIYLNDCEHMDRVVLLYGVTPAIHYSDY